jgi:hypothetical protein
MRPNTATARGNGVYIMMPLLVCDGFVDKCDQASREYATLKNGLILRRRENGVDERFIEIRCDPKDADELLSLAIKIYTDAVTYIKKGIVAAV